MTLDEAITRYKNNAEYERTHGNLQGCIEFRQLAGWLTLLKQILDSGDCNSCVCKKGCSEVPKPGELVRYNCYAYVNRAIQEN